MITDYEASQIASAWHSVMTWNDPGVAMYSVTSTGRVHNEAHRRSLLAYIESCIPAAVDADASRATGDDTSEPVVMDSNVADLEALQEWALAYRIPAAVDADAGDAEGAGEDGEP